MYRTTRIRLIEERKARRWSQQELADRIGTTQNSISRWELGITSPSPYFRAKLCDLLGASASDLGLTIGENGASSQPREDLNPQEAQSVEGVLRTALQETSCLWLVPYRRNPWFTGQETVLARLAHLLPATAEPLALCGMGGIGKTQLALEYAYRHALEYRTVLWIGAETEESIFSSFLRIAEILRLPERDEKDQRRIIAAVQHWLNAHSQWLLIWDNVEDLALFDRFQPATLAGTILLTTRFRVLGTLARSIDLLPIEQEEGMLFLLRRARVLAPEATGEHVHHFAEHMSAQYEACAELVIATGGLPLALDQAGAYIERTQCSLSAYLELFRACHATLLKQRGEGSCDHPESVSATLTLAIAASTQRHPAVRDLLQVCALLQPDAIPEELFRQGATHLGPLLSAACRDSQEWDRVAAAACAYSLLARQPEAQALSLHRLVQMVLLDTMTEVEQEVWNTRAIEALDTVFPDVLPATKYAAWKQCERLLPHALLCLHRVGAAEGAKESLAFASLAYKAAQYLRERGRYAEAEPLFQRALHIRQQTLGPDHLKVASPLSYLAALYFQQGKYAEAEPLFQRALHIRQQALGPDHSDVARALNNLAELSRIQGKYAEAEPLYQRASRILEQALGPDHPLVASTLANLAELYREQHKYAEAELFYQRALHILEQALGPDHPLVAHPCNGLAHLCQEQGEDTEAESLFQRALRIRQFHLGRHHPETAQTLHDLAVFYQKQGNLSEAFSLAERALTIRLHSLGDTHPKTVATRMLYAHLVQEQAGGTEKTVVEQDAETIASVCSEERRADRASSLAQEPVTPHETEQALLQEFIHACCELHPLAWSSAGDLWHAYKHWARDHEKLFSLTRRTFTDQLKAYGCYADRTNTTRIWRGIAIVKQEGDE